MTHTDHDTTSAPRSNPTEDLKSAARHEYDDARDRIAGQAERLKREGGATLKTAVTDELDRRKAGAGAEMRTLAETLRHAADEQSRKAETGVGAAPSSLLGHGADLLEDLSEGLERHSVNDLTRSVSAYARNNPAMFIGGCILAGLAVGRILTATERRGPTNTRTSGTYASGNYDEPTAQTPRYRPQEQAVATATPAAGTATYSESVSPTLTPTGDRIGTAAPLSTPRREDGHGNV